MGDASPLANLMLSVMGAFAEFERSLIKERQREGIALAQQRGVYKGRKKTLTPERAAELVSRPGLMEALAAQLLLHGNAYRTISRPRDGSR